MSAYFLYKYARDNHLCYPITEEVFSRVVASFIYLFTCLFVYLFILSRYSQKQLKMANQN